MFILTPKTMIVAIKIKQTIAQLDAVASAFESQVAQSEELTPAILGGTTTLPKFNVILKLAFLRAEIDKLHDEVCEILTHTKTC